MLSLRIALRYLFSRSRLHAVNYVTGVSTLAVAIVAMALVCVLSVYNGYVELILAGTERTDAELLVRARSGGVFDLNKYPQWPKLLRETGARSCVRLLYSKGLLRADERQWVVEVQGVDRHFGEVYTMEQQLFSGRALSSALRHYSSADSLLPITIGAGLPLFSDSTARGAEPAEVTLLFPKRRGFINPLNPASSFSGMPVEVIGQYPPMSLETDHTIYVPLEGLQLLLDYERDELSALALRYPKGTDLEAVRERLAEGLGSELVVQDREEQHPELSYLIRMEKVMTYLILLFILLLASLNVASSLTMLLLEKRSDYAILYALGASQRMVGSIFRNVGLLIALIGSSLGLVLGLFVSLLQQYFGIISTGAGLSAQALPVKILPLDLVLAFVSVSAISYLISLYPIHFFVRQRKG